jgi:alpha-L-fucosidase
LIDIVSKNGTLLLNIGPRADGTIPEGDEQILLDIGRWLAINGEAIYGSRPWKVYGEGPTEVIEGGFTDSKRAEFTAEDVRFTTKEGALYVIMLGHPQTSELEIRSLGLNAHPVDIRRISLIGTNQPVEWTQRDDALVVHLPALPDNQPAFTLKIDGDQSPEWRGTP